MKYSSVIVTGSIAYDEIMNFPSHFVEHIQPEKLHQLNVSFVVDKLEKQLGGTGTNIAYNLSLVTRCPVKLLAGAGRDANDFLTFFKKNHINTSGILIDNALYTATGKVITDKSDNQIWGFYYGACIEGKNIDFSPHLTSDTVLIISANHPDAFLHAQREAIKHNTSYLYDPGMSLTWIRPADLREGVLKSRWLIGNDYEICRVTSLLGLSEDDLVKKNIAVITTLGGEGVRYHDQTVNLHVASYPVSQVVDPTGAGDAWRGGFIGALLDGESLEGSLKQANSLASFAVEVYGTANHKPSRRQIISRSKKLQVNSL